MDPDIQDQLLHEYLLLIPTTLNDGAPVSTEERNAIEQLICARFGGFTKLGNLEGAWVAPDGRIYRDHSDGYTLAAATETSVLTFAREVGQRLQQHAIYVRRPDNTAVIVPVDPAATTIVTAADDVLGYVSAGTKTDVPINGGHAAWLLPMIRWLERLALVALLAMGAWPVFVASPPELHASSLKMSGMSLFVPDSSCPPSMAVSGQTTTAACDEKGGDAVG